MMRCSSVLVGVADVQVQAAPLERVTEIARVVRGQHDQRRNDRGERSEFGDRNRVVGENLEQERFELLIGLVDLVDEQHGAVRLAQRAQQRPRLEERFGERTLRRCRRASPATHRGRRRRAATRRACRARSACRGAACRTSTRRWPWLRRGPRNTACGSGEPVNAAVALASSVLPTPAGPSTRIGLRRWCAM
jgi:hypothetical protein